MANSADIPFVYFGSPQLSADILSVLETHGLLPSVIVTAPERPRGRGQKLQKSPVGSWANAHSIPALTPEKIDAEFIKTLEEMAPDGSWPLFVVVAYGHILPGKLIYLPERDTINLHPSLLPKLRGPSPIRSAILQETVTGVSIIKLDEQMDHGPIISQETANTDTWPPTYDELEAQLIEIGGKLLATTIPRWTAGELDATPQDDDLATYSRKFTSEDGEIDLSDDPDTNLRKIRAFTSWPKAHFFTPDGKRVLIKKAHLEKGELIIDTVQPAGEASMPYREFKQRN